MPGSGDSSIVKLWIMRSHASLIWTGGVKFFILLLLLRRVAEAGKGGLAGGRPRDGAKGVSLGGTRSPGSAKRCFGTRTALQHGGTERILSRRPPFASSPTLTTLGHTCWVHSPRRGGLCTPASTALDSKRPFPARSSHPGLPTSRTLIMTVGV